MLLCVDGIDPDLIHEYGWGKLFKYNYKLEIPRECFVPDPELGSTPYTPRVWATIFSGKIIDYDLIKREGLRKIAHDFLINCNITWRSKKNKYTIAPSNESLDTILDHYDSFAWNIPTISPEWIATFPSHEAFVKFCRRELFMFTLMVCGSKFGSFDLEAYYTRFIDYCGHNEYKNLKSAYEALLLNVRDWKKRLDVILLSDHGCVDGVHTNYAYLGSDKRFNAKSVDEIRTDLERILDSRKTNT